MDAADMQQICAEAMRWMAARSIAPLPINLINALRVLGYLKEPGDGREMMKDES